MHIAYVTETWPPEINGVSLSAARTVGFLRQRRHRVDVIRPRQREEAPDTETYLVRGFPLPLYRGLRLGLPHWRELERRWRAEPPDLVHVATEGPLGLSAVATANRLGICATSDFRTRFDAYMGHYASSLLTDVALAYLRSFHNSFARTFVPTPELQAELRDEGFERLEVSSRGVDCAQFSPNHRSLALRESWRARGPVVLSVGRLAKEKNLLLAAHAYLAMRAKIPQTRWVIVGDGPLRRMLENLCPEAVFAGNLEGEDLARHYASADVFLFPSLTETFGNVTLEAMASGLAVVAFRTAAAHMHIQSGVNGCTLEPGDDAAFLASCVALAGDLDLARRLGSAARVRARSLDWNGVLSEFQRQLTETLRTRPGHEHPLLA